MRRFKKILWGIALVALGVILGLNAMEITNIDLFFDGWWTLFLILPGLIGLFTDRDKRGNLIVITVGVFLLLASQERIGYDLMWKLLLGVTIVIFGLSLIFRGFFKKGGRSRKGKGNDGIDKNVTCFSSRKLDFSGREFVGTELTAVFGEIVCDLRFAIFTKDTVLRVNAVFGDINILLPANLNVKVSTNSVFGDVNDNSAGSDQMFPITLTVEGNCCFGDIEIK